MKASIEATSDLPSYDLPPVAEVVCGVQFKPLEDLSTPHVGLIWQALQPAFPGYREMPPLPSLIEAFPMPTQTPPKIRITSAPTLPRMWFMNQDESQVIQIQKDRLLTNWKKVDPNQAYPRFGVVSKFFFEQLEGFRAFLKHSELPDIEPLQYEITYVNHLRVGEGWETNKDIAKVLPDIAWRLHKRFLPEPETIQWNSSFVLPGDSSRLHIAVVNAVLEEAEQIVPIIQLTFTVRGIDKSKSLDNTAEWFSMGREWIVKAFADITGDSIQKSIWRRVQ